MTIFALKNSNMAKRILVTGASGFVGSRFVSAMRDRYELLTPSHHALDITSAEDVEQYIAYFLNRFILREKAIVIMVRGLVWQ